MRRVNNLQLPVQPHCNSMSGSNKVFQVYKKGEYLTHGLSKEVYCGDGKAKAKMSMEKRKSVDPKKQLNEQQECSEGKFKGNS